MTFTFNTIRTAISTTITINMHDHPIWWPTVFGNLKMPAQCWNLVCHQLQLTITRSLEPPKRSTPQNPCIMSSASMTLPHDQNHSIHSVITTGLTSPTLTIYRHYQLWQLKPLQTDHLLKQTLQST